MAKTPPSRSYRLFVFLGLRVRAVRSHQYAHEGSGQRQPCDHVRLVMEVEKACAIVTSLDSSWSYWTGVLDGVVGQKVPE